MPSKKPIIKKFRRVRAQPLPLEDLAKIDDSRWKDLKQARKILRKIQKDFLREEELVLMDLKSMDPPKKDREIGTIFGIHVATVNGRNKRLWDLVRGYGWWLKNEETLRYFVCKRLGEAHWAILVQVAHRRRQAEIAESMGASQWMIYKRMGDCIMLLKYKDNFLLFMKALRMNYRLEDKL